MTRRGQDVSREDAHKRAIEDYSQFSQYARSAAQFAFAANGGAAAAILSFLTAITNSATKNPAIDTKAIIHSFAIASSGYLTGLLFSIIAMCLFYLSKQSWGHAWEDTALTGHIDFDSSFARTGARLGLFGNIAIAVSVAAFAPASYFAVAGFFRQPP